MIIVDTNALVALADPADELSARAQRDLEQLASEQLLLPPPALVEACHILRRPAQRIRLMELIERLGMEPTPLVETSAFWSEIFVWLERYAEHDPDWVDAYIAVLCGTNRRWRVWSYDREFRVLWRRPDGSRIPLAIAHS
jgi:predicted nucleic acid-binding protein